MSYWSKYVTLMALASLVAGGCSVARPLHRSQANIRTSLLRRTPLGTPKQEVIAKIGWHVDQKSGPFAAQAQESSAWNTLRLASEQAGNPPVPKEVKSVLDLHFGEYFAWFLGECHVYGVWGFDSGDRLIGVWVYKEYDGL